MKKLAITSALLATTGLAAAQSSVTLFGIADATLQHGSGSTASRTQLGSGGNSSSRLGLRGVEDLGGGWSASFWLEAALNADNGTGASGNSNNQTSGAVPTCTVATTTTTTTTATPAPAGTTLSSTSASTSACTSALNGAQGLVFSRRSTVGLAAGWGELRLGCDYAVQYYNRFEFDPFGNNGVGTSQTQAGTLGGPTNTRVSNAVMYLLPADISGVYGELQYYLGENASNAGATKSDGTGGGVRLGWRSGALNVSLAHARTRFARTASAGDITSTNVAGRYDFGSFTAMGGYFRDRIDTTSGLTGRGAQVGAIFRVGGGEIKAQYSNYKTTVATHPESRKVSLGYVHNLSKRKALYATYARVRNSGGAAAALNGATTGANQSSSGFDLGVRHAF